jgi:hypothetical protein
MLNPTLFTERVVKDFLRYQFLYRRPPLCAA